MPVRCGGSARPTCVSTRNFDRGLATEALSREDDKLFATTPSSEKLTIQGGTGVSMSIRPYRLLLLSLVVFAAESFAQTVSGTIAGHVVDQQGANVVNATVVVVDPDKGVRAEMKTGDQGDFSFSALQPGTYNVTIEAPGFKKIARSDLPLNANDRLSLGDIAMEVGAVTETVEVSGQAAI